MHSTLELPHVLDSVIAPYFSENERPQQRSDAGKIVRNGRRGRVRSCSPAESEQHDLPHRKHLSRVHHVFDLSPSYRASRCTHPKGAGVEHEDWGACSGPVRQIAAL